MLLLNLGFLRSRSESFGFHLDAVVLTYCLTSLGPVCVCYVCQLEKGILRLTEQELIFTTMDGWTTTTLPWYAILPCCSPETLALGTERGGDNGDATRGDEIERRAGRGKIRSSEGGPETRDAAWE